MTRSRSRAGSCRERSWSGRRPVRVEGDPRAEREAARLSFQKAGCRRPQARARFLRPFSQNPNVQRRTPISFAASASARPRVRRRWRSRSPRGATLSMNSSGLVPSYEQGSPAPKRVCDPLVPAFAGMSGVLLPRIGRFYSAKRSTKPTRASTVARGTRNSSYPSSL